jgi:hypothetical protein
MADVAEIAVGLTFLIARLNGASVVGAVTIGAAERTISAVALATVAALTSLTTLAVMVDWIAAD